MSVFFSFWDKTTSIVHIVQKHCSNWCNPINIFQKLDF